MKENAQNSPRALLPDISEQQQQSFNRSYRSVLKIGFLGMVLSGISEVLHHNAAATANLSMEVGDWGIGLGFRDAEKKDRAGDHRGALNRRQQLLGAHVLLAALPMFESARLMSIESRPTVANVAISVLVATLNARYLHHKKKHSNHTAHTAMPTMESAFDDPLDVVQSDTKKQLTARQLHTLNEKGIISIAKSNLVEAGAGLAGAGLYVAGAEQGPAMGVIAGGIGVIALMGQQMWQNRRAQTSAEFALVTT